jgi:hypothetical protein
MESKKSFAFEANECGKNDRMIKIKHGAAETMTSMV